MIDKAPSTDVRNVRLPPVTARGLNIQKVMPGPPKRLSVLVYSPPGGGKTFFAGTFPNPLFIDCQGGMLTVRNKGVSAVAPEDYNDLIQCTIWENVKDFDTIVLDTATEAARLVTEFTTKQSGHELATLPDWMQIIERVRQLLRKLLDLPMHVVVTAEEGFHKDEDTGKMTYGPSLPGKLFGEAGALFDCVFHIRSKADLQKHTVTRLLLTQPDGMYAQAKDRISLPGYPGLEKLEVPDFKVIWDKLSKS